MENVGTKQSAQDPLLQMLHMELLVEPDFSSCLRQAKTMISPRACRTPELRASAGPVL